MEYIILSIPLFFLLMGVELAWSAWTHRKVYRLNDFIANLGCGIGSQVVGAFTKAGIFSIYLWAYDHLRLLTLPSTALTWVVAFLLVDLLYYWFHRLSHEINFLWAIHVVHHQSEEYNLTVALRQAAFQPLVSWVFYLPLALVGFPPAMFATIYSLNIIYQFWIHTRAIPKLGALEWVINTPSHHRVHHGSDTKYLDRNHAGTLIIWDRLFGTFQEEEEEPRYGVTRPLRSFNPLWAHFHSFVALYNDARALPRLRDRLLLWIMPPGWWPTDAPPRKPLREPFDPPTTWRMRLYVLAHFIPATLLASALLVIARRLPAWETAALACAVVLTLFTLGALLDQKRWALPLERARVVALGAAGGWALIHWATRGILPG